MTFNFATIRTRRDLDNLAATHPDAHQQFMERLRGSMLKTVDIAVYPDNYGADDYQGEVIEPILEQRPDFGLITRFGFAPDEFA